MFKRRVAYEGYTIEYGKNLKLFHLHVAATYKFFNETGLISYSTPCVNIEKCGALGEWSVWFNYECYYSPTTKRQVKRFLHEQLPENVYNYVMTKFDDVTNNPVEYYTTINDTVIRVYSWSMTKFVKWLLGFDCYNIKFV